MNLYLDSVELKPGSGNYTYAYQWSTWDFDSKERTASNILVGMRLLLTCLSLIQGFLKHSFILRTLALAHLTGIGGNGEDDGRDELDKPIGALILSMQAVRGTHIVSFRLII